MMSRTNIVLAALLVAVVVGAMALRRDLSRPNLQILPHMMKYTPAYHSYAPNPIFANGRTLQAPVPGTIARGEMPLHYGATKEEAVRAGEELRNPYDLPETAGRVSDASGPDASESSDASRTEANGSDGNGSEANGDRQPDEQPSSKPDEQEPNPQEAQEAAARERLQASVRRGGEVYRVYCVCCHGPTGLGDGPVAKRGFPPPPSMLTGKSLQMKDGQLFHILTYGQGSMAPFAAQLAPGRRWDAINYVRDLQQSAPPTPPAAPTDADPTSEAEAPSPDAEAPPPDADTPSPDTDTPSDVSPPKPTPEN